MSSQAASSRLELEHKLHEGVVAHVAHGVRAEQRAAHVRHLPLSLRRRIAHLGAVGAERLREARLEVDEDVRPPVRVVVTVLAW